VNNYPGKFISLEGSEGAGKTTSLTYIEHWFKQQGISPVMTREPGGTPLAEEIRELLLSTRDEIIDPDSELLLMYAARRQHIQQLIIPHLEQGRWVVSDRFNDASFAYQGFGRGLDMQRIEALDNWCLGGFKPDLTLFLDLSVSVGMERAGRRSAPDRFEKEQISFFENVRCGYLQRASADPARVKVIDASGSIEQVQELIARQLEIFSHG